MTENTMRGRLLAWLGHRTGWTWEGRVGYWLVTNGPGLRVGHRVPGGPREPGCQSSVHDLGERDPAGRSHRVTVRPRSGDTPRSGVHG